MGGPKRTDLMHNYAAKYNEHKEAMREEYRDKEVAGLTFKPKLNVKSI